MANIALVIGNGFDLDLGLMTKYSDFANDRNPEWRNFLEMKDIRDISKYRKEFVEHMQMAREKEYWFDIEQEIYRFVNGHFNPQEAQVGSIRMQFEQLRNCLKKYFRRVAVAPNVKEKSLAKDLLIRLDSLDYGCNIITYNYTNCFSLCGLPQRKIHPIHGTLDWDMTLGCREYEGKKPIVRWDFLYKLMYQGTKDKLTQYFSNSQEVIILGHSLNRIDYCYFEDLFEGITQGISRCDHLTIICKDSNSELQIRKNLEGNVDLSKIGRLIDVQFIYTDLWYKEDVTTLMLYEQLCNRIA